VRFALFGSCALTLAISTSVALRAPEGDRSGRAFDADRLAELELAMWRAYYRKEKVALFRLLVTALREQFHYSWERATEAGFHLARAAASFGDARGGYDRVLPDLERGYLIARDWSGARYDPKEVARAELAWWVARRDARTRDPDHVGRLIGVLYSQFYQLPLERVVEAGLLRARAGALRDAGGADADWAEVGRLLHASYRSLRAAVGPLAPAR
jgi:hypothetical protein